MDLSIRIARPTDVERLLELYELLAGDAEPPLSLEQAHARFDELVANPRHTLHVAERDGQTVGTFSMIFMPGLSHGARDSCIVEDVVVAAGYQGAGIGQQMMRFAMAACVARGCYKLVLSSHVKRERAHRFYEGLGFRKHGYSYLLDLAGEPAGAP